jgi:hypothetical protein
MIDLSPVEHRKAKEETTYSIFLTPFSAKKAIKYPFAEESSISVAQDPITGPF